MKPKQDLTNADVQTEFERAAIDIEKQLEREIANIEELSVKDGVDRLCNILRKDRSLSFAAIRKKIITRMCPKIWNEKTARQYWPTWMSQPNRSAAREKDWAEGKHDETYSKNQAQNDQNTINQDEADREEEEQPVSSMSMEDWQETHPQIAKSSFESLGEINRSIARLWTALTEKKDMPTREDDVKHDHIIPTRQYRRDIVAAISEVERDFLYNWLVWLSEATNDMLTILDRQKGREK